MDTPFFSVIIPIYNVEKYLNECVDSVLAQTFTNIEIILVDDGSPDQCPKICDAYEKKDSRITVIHKTNGGLSDARNAGVRIARGQYLLFLDSDDYWDDSDALTKLYAKINEYGDAAEVVVFQAKLFYPDGSFISDSGQYDNTFNEMAPDQALCYMAERGLLIGSACSKAVKRSFFVGHNLFFKVGIKSEDIDWIIRVANCLPKYLYSDQYFYIYRKGRNDSITASADSAYLAQFTDMLEGFIYHYDYANDTAYRCLLSLVAYEFSILMAKIANLPDKAQKKSLVARIRKMQNVLQYDMHPKVQITNKVKKLIGFELTMCLLGIYLKYRKR